MVHSSHTTAPAVGGATSSALRAAAQPWPHGAGTAAAGLRAAARPFGPIGIMPQMSAAPCGGHPCSSCGGALLPPPAMLVLQHGDNVAVCDGCGGQCGMREMAAGGWRCCVPCNA
eukprot:gene48343-35687_t